MCAFTSAMASQKRLALDAGIDRSYVSRIEHKVENCTVAILEKLAELVGCKATEFFGEPDGGGILALKSGRKRKSP
jgi:transcriptional regulator with XRE-family HTH domain